MSTQSSVRFLVHKSAVGAIIGKAGANVQKINQASGATIEIDKSFNQDSYLSENVRDVVLTINFAESKQLVAALNELAPILHHTRVSLLAQRQPPKTIPEDEHYLTALIHTPGVSTLLENEGAFIKNVREVSKAVISVRDRLPQSSECSISFKGTLDQVTKAIIECLQPLLNRTGADKAAFNPFVASIIPRTGDEISTRSFQVNSSLIPALLNNHGARVKFIRKVTSCAVSIDFKEGEDADKKSDKTTVTVKGPQSNLQHAVHMVRYTQQPARTEQRAR